eukprot:m.131228 g.131228  ORF g.131228 m.131228 type:complete len:506 (-) comp23721_c0_seq2:18-1535(-)
MDVCCKACSIHRLSPQAGTKWLFDALPLMRYLRILQHSLQEGGAPRTRVRKVDNQCVAQVYPLTKADKVFSYKAEVWMQPNKEPSQSGYRFVPATEGRVVLVAGTGEVSTTGLLSALYHMFVQHDVVLLVFPPQHQYAGPLLEHAFQPLIETGFLAFAYGDKQLCSRLRVSTHLNSYLPTWPTGGPLLEGVIQRTDPRVEDKRLSVAKPDPEEDPSSPPPTPVVTTRLPLTPIIVAGPGCVWSDDDIEDQAAKVASMVVNNACGMTLLVLPERSGHSRELVEAIKRVLMLTAARPHPLGAAGVAEQYAKCSEVFPHVENLSATCESACQPFLFIPSIDETQFPILHHAFLRGVIGVITVPGDNFVVCMRKTLALVNQPVFGGLSCCLLAHPDLHSNFKEEFAAVIRDLKFGAIAVNCWPGIMMGLGVTTWGKYNEDLSQVCTCGNGLMFDFPQKSVLYSSWRPMFKPPWNVTHRHRLRIARGLTMLEASPSYLKLAALNLECLVT